MTEEAFGGFPVTRISANTPTAIQAVPVGLRGLVNYCPFCLMPDRLDLYTPQNQYVRRGEISCSYRCDNGHGWLRKFGAYSSEPIKRTPGLIGYLEHHDRDRPNTVGVWCKHCCIWHLHPVASMVPDRVAHFPAKCYLRNSPFRRSGYQVWTGETPLAVVREATPDANQEQRRALRGGRSTPEIDRMQRSAMGVLLTDIVQSAVGGDCNPAPVTADEAVSKRCALYRHYDADDVLLYIGITERLMARGKTHAGSADWVQFAVRAEARWYPTRREAEVAEVAAIRTERPVFNRRHNDTPEARSRLTAYLIEQGREDLIPAVVPQR